MIRGLVATAIVVAFVHTAHAESALDDARKAVDSSDYMGARTALTAALDAGNASPSDLAEIYKLTGVVAGALGEADAATAAFAKWIALDPKAALPPGTSPKIMRPFSAASEKAKKGELLKVRTETSVTPPSITVIVAADPLHLVAGAHVMASVDGALEQAFDGKGHDRIKIDLPKGKRLDLRVAVLDSQGNHLVELGSADVPIVIVGEGTTALDHDVSAVLQTKHESPKTSPATPSHPRPLYATWWVWGAGAAVFGGVGAYFGFAGRSAANDLDHLNATSSDHQFSEARDLESTARRDLLVFDIGMGIAGAAAIGAAILYVTEPRIVTERRVSVVPAAGGGTVVLRGHF
jgi:hypothetical protein